MTIQNPMRFATALSLLALYVPAAMGALFFETFLLSSLFIWFLLVVTALLIWSKIDAKGIQDWLWIAAAGAGLTAVSFLLDCAIGKFLHPELGFVEAGVQSLGFLFTLLFGAVAISAALGAARSWIACRLTQSLAPPRH
jgi:hypothetical protein